MFGQQYLVTSLNPMTTPPRLTVIGGSSTIGPPMGRTSLPLFLTSSKNSCVSYTYSDVVSIGQLTKVAGFEPREEHHHHVCTPPTRRLEGGQPGKHPPPKWRQRRFQRVKWECLLSTSRIALVRCRQVARLQHVGLWGTWCRSHLDRLAPAARWRCVGIDIGPRTGIGDVKG